MSDEAIGIIGAGIVGLAIGRELTKRRPGARIVVVEKESRVAVHQTGHNSGVVHAGIYYQPGSLKALLCTRGGAMLREYCADRELPYDECGKLVVAVTADDVTRLDALAARAGVNLVPGLRRVPWVLSIVTVANVARAIRQGVREVQVVGSYLAARLHAATGGGGSLSTP